MAIMQEIETKLQKGISVSSNEGVYFSLLDLVKDKAAKKATNDGKKKIYSISAEFLIGKLLSNNLINLGLYDEVKETLEKNGKTLAEIEEIEMEPSLGTVDLDVLPLVLWIPCPLSTILPRDFPFAMSTDFSSKK